jgi:hypothetical protein
MGRGEKQAEALRKFTYTHLRVVHGADDAPFALKQIAADRPGHLLLEYAGLSVKEREWIVQYVANQSGSATEGIGAMIGDPYMRSLCDGLRALHAQTAYAPILHFIDYTDRDPRLPKYDTAIGRYTHMVSEYGAKHMSYTAAVAHTKATLDKFITENQKREEVMRNNVTTALEREASQRQPVGQRTCMIITGATHRRVSDQLRKSGVEGSVVAQLKPHTLSFAEEYIRNSMHGVQQPAHLVGSAVFEGVFSLFATTFGLFLGKSEQSRNGFVRRVAAQFNPSEQEDFYARMLRQDKPGIVSMLTKKGIPVGNASR